MHLLVKSIIIFHLLSSLLYSQEALLDKELVIGKIKDDSIKTVELNNSLKTKNIFIGFYKFFLSEQLSANCEFCPSCSIFARDVIHDFGILQGVLMTADRLTRCGTQFSDKNNSYLFDRSNAKIIDSSAQYCFDKK